MLFAESVCQSFDMRPRHTTIFWKKITHPNGLFVAVIRNEKQIVFFWAVNAEAYAIDDGSRAHACAPM